MNSVVSMTTGAATRSEVRFTRAPRTAQAVLLLALLAAAAVAFFATSPEATSQAVAASGADLTRLLRSMAFLKALMAVAAAAAIIWRLAAPVTLAWLTAYAVAVAAMSSGPVLIWDMAHVWSGAMLLHGGLLAAVLLLWRDPEVGSRLGAIVAKRRAALARQSTG